ncbi:MAG: amidohydrolase family protein [Mycobacteriales bacterium]
MPVIDAHVHVWTQDPARYPFQPLDDLPPPDDARTPADLAADLAVDCAAEPVGGVLLIQPRVYGYDHRYVYSAAQAMAGRARVMPLIDGNRPNAARTLREHARSSLTAGFRVIALGRFCAEWLCSAAASLLWQGGAGLGLPVGFLVDPNQLPFVSPVAESHPRLTIVIDHLARCGGTQLAEWTAPLCALVQRPNVYVKVSALDALSGSRFPHRDMWPLVRAVHDAGGARKLLWGSDWPHSAAYGGYGDTRAAIAQALADASAADLDAIFGATAAQLFGFDRTPRWQE